MSNERLNKRGKLSYELLGLFAVCLAVTVVLYFFLAFSCVAIAENYCWERNIILNEEQLYHLDSVVFSANLAISVIFFIILFMALFGERLSYIATIIKGVDTLRSGNLDYRLPIEGNNELTSLAEAINYLSETERSVKEKEMRLHAEREELIRTLSHDIRTPLTSVISYTELLASKPSHTAEEISEYLSLVGKKSEQMKCLTNILLDGGRRETEFFEDCRFLMEQLVGEFEEALEAEYSLSVDLSDCPNFSGFFDVNEMRRLFDNMVSNVQKYADPQKAVSLTVRKTEEGLCICQHNAVKTDTGFAESHRMGLYSMRRIAHNYGGSVKVREDRDIFEIEIVLSEF